MLFRSIKCDLTVTRLGEARFMIVTGGAMGLHALDWMRSHLPDDGSVGVADVTSGRCCIGLWGPRARDLLSRVCDSDVSDAGFPYLTAKAITIGEVPALALRISYVGELGWEIYAPAEHGLRLWDTLWEAGLPLGVIAAGGGAFDSLRLEKGYRLWGADIHTEYDPYEAGLGFAVKMQKGDFVGRDALLAERQSGGPARRLVGLHIDWRDIAAQQGAQGLPPRVPQRWRFPLLPVRSGDRHAGYANSIAWSPRMGGLIGLARIGTAFAEPGTDVLVDWSLAGSTYEVGAVVSELPFVEMKRRN